MKILKYTLLIVLFNVYYSLFAICDTIRFNLIDFEKYVLYVKEYNFEKIKKDSMLRTMQEVFESLSADTSRVMQFYDRNHIVFEGKYDGTSFLGSYKEYYKNGKLKINGFYDNNGIPKSKWVFYKKNGIVSYIINFAGITDIIPPNYSKYDANYDRFGRLLFFHQKQDNWFIRLKNYTYIKEIWNESVTGVVLKKYNYNKKGKLIKTKEF